MAIFAPAQPIRAAVLGCGATRMANGATKMGWSAARMGCGAAFLPSGAAFMAMNVAVFEAQTPLRAVGRDFLGPPSFMLRIGTASAGTGADFAGGRGIRCGSGAGWPIVEGGSCAGRMPAPPNAERSRA